MKGDKMGLEDPHWCSKCKKDLDKKKDTYIEINVMNPDKKKAQKEGLHTRVLICSECLKDKEEVNKFVDELRKHANPNFICKITCASTGKCPDFTPRKGKVNCKHIFVQDTTGKVYCNRRHPGATVLQRDRRMADAMSQKAFEKNFRKYFKTLGIGNIEGFLKNFNEMNKGLGGMSVFDFSTLKIDPMEEIVVDKPLVKEKQT